MGQMPTPFEVDDPSIRPRNLRIQSVKEDDLEPELREKLAILQRKKQEAVETEDFDAAIEFKDITDKLKLIGSDLNMLNNRKREAIEGEDFETAKVLKMQMERLKLLVLNLDPENPFGQTLQDEYSMAQS